VLVWVLQLLCRRLRLLELGWRAMKGLIRWYLVEVRHAIVARKREAQPRGQRSNVSTKEVHIVADHRGGASVAR